MDIPLSLKGLRHADSWHRLVAKGAKRVHNKLTRIFKFLSPTRSSLFFVLVLTLSIGLTGPPPIANAVFQNGVWSSPIQASIRSTVIYTVNDTSGDSGQQNNIVDKRIDMRWYWCSDSRCTFKRLWTSSSVYRPIGLTMLSYSPELITNGFGRFTVEASARTIPGSYYFQIRVKTATQDDYSTTQLLSIDSTVMRKVTFLGNTSDGGSTASQSENTKTLLTANGFTKVGYTFTNWNTAADGTGDAYGADASYSFNSDLTLYAQWIKNAAHKVTYTNGSNEAIGESPIQSNVSEGLGFIIAENPFTLAGYTFSAWSDETTNYEPGVVYTMRSNDVVLTAKWSPVASTSVKFDPNGGVGIMNSQSSNIPRNLIANTFSRAGFTFAGWSTTPNGSVIYGNTGRYSFSVSITIYAHWSANATHSVTYSAGSNVLTGLAPTQHDVAEGASFTVAVNTFSRPGYTFGYWISSGSGIAPAIYLPENTYIMGASNVTLTAQWNLIADFIVSFVANEGVGSDYSQATNIPTKLITNTFTRVGYTFGGWATSRALDAAVAYPDEAIYSFASNVTFFATWNTGMRRSVKYTLADGTGTVPVQPARSEGRSFFVAEGNGLTRAGFTFSGWTDGTLSYAPGSTYVVGKVNITLTAQWSALGSHSINYKLNGGTGTVATQADVVEGLSFNVAAHPANRPGFTFVTWSDGFSSFSPGAIYVVERANVTLTAIWSQNTFHTVTYSVGSTTVSSTNPITAGAGPAPVQVDVPEGASFILAGREGFTRPGFTFNKWSDGTNTFDPGFAYTMGANNVVLTAVWTVKPARTVTYNLGGGVGTVPTQAPVIQGLTFRTSVATGFTREGFTFSKWNNGAVNYAAGVIYTASNTDIVLTAVWDEVITRTVTYNLGEGTGTLPTQPNVAVGATFVLADSKGITRAGFAFTSWTDGTTRYLPGATYTVGATNVTLTAGWSAIVFRTVTYALGGGTGTLQQQTPMATGSEIQIANDTDLTLNGSIFTSWSDGTSTFAPGATYTIPARNVVLTAQWSAAPTRTIRYALGGGIGTLPTESPLPPEGMFVVADDSGITRTGFTLSSWSDGVSNFEPGATYKVGNSNIVLRAIWVVALPRTITYVFGGGNGTLPIQAAVPIGSTFRVANSSIISRTGFAFAGWSDGTVVLQPGAVYTVGTNNIVLTAQWISEVTHSVNYLSGGAAGTKPASLKVAVGTSFAVAAAAGLTKARSSFGSWSDGSENYSPGELYTVGDANITLTAMWIPAIHRTVTYSLSGGTGTLPAHAPIAEGTTFRVSSSSGLSRTGFTFSGWSNGGITYLPGGAFKMGSSDVVLIAVWKVKK